ncbi:MAG: hypothetical protein RBR68_15835 [Tenuifilaceae bacterium]|nr:hypothetical protein [Tenuifilaceae bacterium]
MSKRENILVVDVETCGDFGSSLVYDLGLAVVERATGRIIESHSLVISDVFYDMPEKMESAYYAAKLPSYHDGIAAGIFKVVNLWEAWRLVRDTIAKYNIRRVYAYNAGFDKNALNFTMRTITAGKYHNFMPRGVKWSCIMNMACQTLFSQPSYLRFAEANGLISEKGNLRTGAEAAYAYITRTPDFEESHTGLADVEIEVAILHKILRQKKRMNEKIDSNAWKIPQKAHKARRAGQLALSLK